MTEKTNINETQDKYILSVDIGTTVLKCQIFDKSANVIGHSASPIDILNPRQGWYEIKPEHLWIAFIECVNNALNDAQLNANDILCIGLSTLRGAILTWDRVTGEPFHNFIPWNDLRSDKICNEWNNSFRLKCLKTGAKILHFFTRSKRFLAASLLKFSTAMNVMRLLWVLENVPHLRERAIEGRVIYGNVDTYLIWKLTNGNVHATDPSNACVSGFYDPFQMKWAQWAIDMFNIPPSILPIVQDTNGNFGDITEELFGCSIPIRAVIGDQQSAMFGECCFQRGDVKCTLGTGSFIDINTGTSPHASYKGLYPIVGWKLVDSKPIYLAEGGSYGTGSAIVWAQKMGFFNDPNETNDIAKSVSNSGGVYFVPAFSGLQAPINDNRAVTAFIGINPNTSNAHLVRAILESLAFRIKQMYEIILEEADFTIKKFRVNGGVSSNDFVVQLMADLTGNRIDRSNQRDMSCLGAAFLAGLAMKFWSNENEISQLRISEKVFHPRDSWTNHYKQDFANWERAIERCLMWHQP